MPTAEKAQAIDEAKDWYKRSKGLVFTDYRGLKVKDMQVLRANLKQRVASCTCSRTRCSALPPGRMRKRFPPSCITVPPPSHSSSKMKRAVPKLSSITR